MSLNSTAIPMTDMNKSMSAALNGINRVSDYVMSPMNWPALIMLIILLALFIAFWDVILKNKGDKI